MSVSWKSLGVNPHFHCIGRGAAGKDARRSPPAAVAPGVLPPETSDTGPDWTAYPTTLEAVSPEAALMYCEGAACR